jgi:hypothetical protein
VAQVVQQVAVKQRLALLGQAQRVVDFVARLARHHAAQKLHIGRWNFHVDHEVGTGKAEQHQQVVFAKQRRVYDHFGALRGAVLGRITRRIAVITGTHHQGRLGVQNRQRKREFVEAVDQLANDVTALVAKNSPVST